jgi:hypothetical protein
MFGRKDRGTKSVSKGIFWVGGQALGAALKICYGVSMAALSGAVIAGDRFSKRRDAYRGRYGKQPLRKTEERCT